jgi:hypothetical protein
MSKNKKIFLLIIFSFSAVILGGIFFNQNVLAVSAVVTECRNHGCSWSDGYGCLCSNEINCKDNGCQWENNKCICLNAETCNRYSDESGHYYWDSNKKLCINYEKSDCLSRSDYNTYNYWDEYASYNKCQSINNYSYNCSGIPGCSYDQMRGGCSCSKEQICEYQNDCNWDYSSNRCVCSTAGCEAKGCWSDYQGGCNCPKKFNPVATSGLSSWCKTAYCGGCSQEECESDEILPSLQISINKICQWDNGFCVAKSKSSSNPKISKQRNFMGSFVSGGLYETVNSPLTVVYNSNSTKAFGGERYDFEEGTHNWLGGLLTGLSNALFGQDDLNFKSRIKIPNTFVCSRSSSNISAEQNVCQNAGCQWNSYVNLCICQTPETCAKNYCQWDSDNNICNCNNYEERCRNHGCSWVNGKCNCGSNVTCEDNGCQWENNKCICLDEESCNRYSDESGHYYWDSNKKLCINYEKSDCLSRSDYNTYNYWDEYASYNKCQSINNYSYNCSGIPGCSYDQMRGGCSCSKEQICEYQNDCNWDYSSNRCVCSTAGCEAKGCWSDGQGGCNCGSYTFLQPLCGYKNPWFINEVETYTINTNEPSLHNNDGKNCVVCQYIIDNYDKQTGTCTAPGESDSIFPQLKIRPSSLSSTRGILTHFKIRSGWWSEVRLKGETLYWLSKSNINSFRANRTSIQKGEPVVISWDVDGALYGTSVGINDGSKNIAYSSSDTGSIWDKIIKKAQGILAPVVPYDDGGGGGSSGYRSSGTQAYQIYLYPNISSDGKIIKGSSGAYFAGNIGEKGSVTVYPDEDTVFYLGMKGVSGEGTVFLTSDPVKVTVMSSKIDLDVKKTTDSNYTDGPITINEGEGINLKWNGYDLSSCTVSSSPQNSSWTGSVSTTGNKTINGLTETTTFNIQCITNTNTQVSDNVVINVNKQQRGTIEVKVKLDGNEWSGPIEYSLSGPQLLRGSAPKKFDVAINNIGDSYTLNYISGGPASASFKNISPFATQIVSIGGTTTFYINFETLNQICTINVSALYNDSPWEGNVTFALSGPTTLNGNKVPSNYEEIPAGYYSLSYISGGPTSNEGKVVVYDGVVGGGSKICSPTTATQFVMKFVDQIISTPTPSPSTPISLSPDAKINCEAEIVETNYCSGTADGDSNTPTITLFSASTDPDGDIESCHWKIYNSENEIEKESDTCQPITFGDEVGIYRATLEVVDRAENKDEDDYTFEVKKQIELIADFSWEPEIPTVTKQVNFFDRSISEGDSITKWSWNFEGATPATSKDQNPTGVIFKTSGPKSVTLTITNSSGTEKTVTKTINVKSINPEWEEVIPK